MIRFGFDSKKSLTGCDLYVRMMQIASILPAAYIIVASGYLYIFTVNGILPLMFDAGISVLPRWYVLILSFVYRKTLSEVIVFFILMASALVFGLVMNRLLKENEGLGGHQRKIRYVFIALIAIDLVLRLIPLGFTAQFGTAVSIVGATVRIACLGLLLMDLRAE